MFDSIVNFSKGAVAIVGGLGLVWTGADLVDRRPVMEYEVIQLADLLDSKLFKVQEQQIAITKAMNSTRFWALMDKLKANGSLSFEEQQDLCRVAHELKYVGIPGCPN